MENMGKYSNLRKFPTGINLELKQLQISELKSKKLEDKSNNGEVVSISELKEKREKERIKENYKKFLKPE